VTPRAPQPSPIAAVNRHEKRRARSRAAILEAAVALFQEHGIRATKVEDVCARADVALRTFFNHFETRDHLYDAIGSQRAEQLAAILDALADDPRRIEQRLRGFFRGTGRYLEARPLYRELVGAMLNQRLDGTSEITRTRLLGQAARRFIESAVARGEATTRHAPEVLADILIGSLTTALTNWTAGDDYALERELVASADALLDLLSPEARMEPS
jgi:AcrR family transcriptional regulator